MQLLQVELLLFLESLEVSFSLGNGCLCLLRQFLILTKRLFELMLQALNLALGLTQT